MVERTPKPRVVEPSPAQGVIRFEMPEDTQPADHPVRVLDRMIRTLDLSGFTSEAKAVKG